MNRGARRGGRCAGLALVLPVLLPGCHREAGAPSLLLISLDTTRADHCSAYGYERETAPNLEKLGEQGVRFAVWYAPSATTGPTHATLFTSLPPITHRVIKNGVALGPVDKALAERLQQAGWQTGGIVSSYVLDAKFGFDQGFEHWNDDFDPETATVHDEAWEGDRVEVFDRTADATTQRAIAWLDVHRSKERPFLFVHYYDPPAPWVSPPEFASRFPKPTGRGKALAAAVARYDAEIAFTDHEVGVLLAALDERGLEDDTVVVVTADHGEGPMQHGQLLHGVHIYEEQVRVPLLLRWPGRLPAARVIEAPVSLIDLAPTLLELLGVGARTDDTMDGRSLVPLIEGRDVADPTRPVFLFRQHFVRGRVDGTRVAGEQYGVRVGYWKMIVAPEEGTREFDDLVRDPEERRDRGEEAPSIASELERRIAAWRAEHTREGPAPFIPPAETERLRALGYAE